MTDNNACFAQYFPTGAACGLPKGHLGAHRASNDDGKVITWHEHEMTIEPAPVANTRLLREIREGLTRVESLMRTEDHAATYAEAINFTNEQIGQLGYEWDLGRPVSVVDMKRGVMVMVAEILALREELERLRLNRPAPEWAASIRQRVQNAVDDQLDPKPEDAYRA